MVSCRGNGIGTFCYLFDERGNVAERTDSTGAVTGSEVYDAYGARTGTASQADSFGYEGQAGYYTDLATGLILCTHRFYDPQAGRFVTRDPIGYDGGINLYGYTGNDPVNEDDPSGLDPYIVHPTNATGSFTGTAPYQMDVPHNKSLARITASFGRRSKHTPALLIFSRENQNGQGNDFKVGCTASNDPTSLYHRRALGGNFLYGAEAAAAGWDLDSALGGGQDFRRAGSVFHPGRTLRDIFSGNKRAIHNDFTHPADEQQAIQDGFNWWKRINHIP